MDKKELTAEEKEYITQVATGGTQHVDVGLLDKIRMEFLNGKTIEEVESTYFGDTDKLTSPEMEKADLEKEPAENTIAAFEKAIYTEKIEEIQEEAYSDKKNPNQRARAEPEKEENLSSPDLQEQDLAEKNMAYSEAAVFEEPDIHAPSKKEDSLPVQVEKEELQTRMAEEIKVLREEITKVKEKNQQIEESIRNWKREVLEMQKPEKEKVSVPKPSKRKWFHFWPEKKNSGNYIVRLLSNPKFTTEQIIEIRLAVEADLEESQIKSFARAEVPARQMKEIRLLYETQNKKEKE